MECEVKRGHRRLVFAAVCLAMLAVAALTATLLGCSPSQPTADTGSGTAAEQNVGEASSDDAAAGQPVNWTMESDCLPYRRGRIGDRFRLPPGHSSRGPGRDLRHLPYR